MTTTSISGPAAYLDELRDRASALAAVPHRAGRRGHAAGCKTVRALLDGHQPAHRIGGPDLLRRGLLLRARAVRRRAAGLRDAVAFTATVVAAAAPMAALFLLVGSGLA